MNRTILMALPALLLLAMASPRRPSTDLGTAVKRLLPAEQHAAADFLLAHMPEGDRATLTPEFLAEHVAYAFRAREAFPWARDVPEDLFLNDVLPFANLDEPRDAWRKPFFERFGPMVEDCETAGEAAVRLNTRIFDELGVAYSRQRSRACMSPFETMQEGKASCTGLSILLVSACRAVGIPARVVGTPSWVDGGGNHTWVEVWDDGWHVLGASESTALNRTWFAQRAAQQISDQPRHAIYAASFQPTGTHFPLVWAPSNRSVPAVNVTERYAIREADTASLETLEPLLSEHRLADLLAQLEEQDLRIRPEDLAEVTERVWQRYVQEVTGDERRQAEQENRAIAYDGKTMRYATTTIGEKPEEGYPLYIALHGGGGAPARVNDSQWNHMQVYYRDGVERGIYLAPRGVNNEWNLHWRDQSFVAYDRIIENMIAFGQVDPNRVYLLGFSAGGDAVYQVAARMPDRWAGAAMSAGHPNNVRPDNYAGLAFLIQVGERDAAYNRNRVAAEYGVRIGALREAHPGLYPHATYIHAGRDHGFMDRGPANSTQRVFTDPAAWLEKGAEAPTEEVDAHSVRWLDRQVRDPLPRKIVWNLGTRAHRSGDREAGFWPTAEKGNLHYWIGIDRFDADVELEADRIVVELDDESPTIQVREIGNFVRFYLHPDLFEPGKDVTVQVEGRTLTATPRPSLRVLVQSVLDRGDPRYLFPASVTLHRNPEGDWMVE